MRVFEPHRFGLGVSLQGLAAALPARVVTNEDLVALGAPLTAEEMVKLSGIQTRRWLSDGESTSDLATRACVEALKRGAMGPADVRRLVLATVSPDHPSPATACFVHRNLGLGEVPSYDVTATCTGFVFALEQAARTVATGDEAVLAVAADARSRWLDVKDRATCALFGDGAAAALVTPGAVGSGVLAVGTLTEGSGVHSVHVPAGGARLPASAATVEARQHFIRMADGPAVYMQAVEGMLATAEALLKHVGMAFSEVDLLVPHQPNRRLLERMVRLARLPMEKVVVNVERLGNMSAASTPVALVEALEARRVGVGAHVLLVAAGAGYTAGAALLKVDEAMLRGCTP
jgi:3-oxoacyl-[acyl-carrier-protein] synthase-3